MFLAARWAETAERLVGANVARTEAVRVDDITTAEDLDQRWELM